ncbi:thiamine pyrophosphate-dependent dehydrogenase E1 component subunit alpha [Heliobacillus mobilis]|uniref:Thiamine pyrophosphate-dependent dehydrogenase E1 component subunit alpha n=1 Tax=Heliobacterium mobile TaxID=28064 RepID=A0A6I3SLA4_HELMO|nr:thiamine pyrophosphate-dependent dehydrogenase E1 component subunit alpha [Heliobacterium mobile]MTV49690.1 thiamine pyrophosphate-dependent dehydrogenase E1 component subunit alpha [Heliobacterium mobile]
MSKIDRKELNLHLYKHLYLVRNAEEAIRKHYHEDEMKTPVHLSIGSEAISVGVCQAMQPQDQALATFRNHAVYLTKTGETDRFFAELYGKSTGVAKGKSGSMHLSAMDNGMICATAIVASGIPVAVGAALANKMQKNGKVVAVFFGDGATEEGVFWESLNIACLMKLPILFVCEDNELAVHAPNEVRKGYRSLTAIARQYRCHVFSDDTTDVEAIYHLTQEALYQMAETEMPCLIDLKYYRYLEHVGVNEDFNAGYRSRADYERWLKQDPVIIQREKLLSLGCSESEIRELERLIDGQIESSLAYAKSAPFPEPNQLHEDVYA